jgi:hypothetical protein
MTQNLIDRARILIREEIANATYIVDANTIAAAVREHYPSVDFQSLTAAVIEEVVAARGSLSWGSNEQIGEAGWFHMMPM